jgi:23S rRNA U2552 (ribose-2'-O)-methylase RlmE/FtsJ
MAYINIPSLNFCDLRFNFNLKDEPNKEEEIFMSNSLNHYLSNIKQQIDEYSNYWDYYKKLTNPYEFIHTQVPEIKFSICKYKPLSRSFFKMIEIINTFSFLCEKNTINCFHLAEGPGGFIEAFNYKRNNKGDKYYGMTLISDDINIPSWKKSSHFINNNSNVIIEYGSTKTGDLFIKENLLYCNDNYGNTMDYITADGGFDFSVDFNKQEELSMKLIIAQIFFAIIMQKEGGNFVLKIFDIFKFKTVEIIFLLANLYDYVYIYKPYTSRVANSEKYVICKNYKNNNETINKEIINNFDYLLNNIDNIYSLFNITLPKLFLKKIEEINAIYGQQQIENINTTLNFIREFINIKHNNYNLSDSENDDVIEDKESNTLLNNNLLESSNIIIPIPIPIPIENSRDTELVNDLFKLDSNNSSYSSPILNPQTKFSYLKNENSFVLNPKKSNYDLSDDSDNDNKSSSNNDEEEILCSDLKNAKLTNVSNYEKFNNRINVLKNINIQKSVNWCNKYNFPINKHFLNN